LLLLLLPYTILTPILLANLGYPVAYFTIRGVERSGIFFTDETPLLHPVLKGERTRYLQQPANLSTVNAGLAKNLRQNHGIVAANFLQVKCPL